MDNQPIFKSALFGGFERQSVLNYIYEMVNGAQEVQDRLNAQLEEVSSSREKLEQSVRGLEQRISDAEKARNSLGEELHNVKVKNGELSSMLDSLNDEISRQKTIVQEKDDEIRRFNLVKAELEQKNADLEQRTMELQRGRDEIEKTKLHIGELVVKSRLDAEKILEEASLKAREVVEEANLKAQEAEEEAILKARETEEEAGKALRDIYDQFGKFRVEIERIEERIEEAVVSMREKFAAIGEAINQGENHIRSFYRPSRIALAPSLGSDENAGREEEFFRGAAE